MTSTDDSQEKREQTHRAFKCPRCDGEFDEWDKVGAAMPMCPFCGLRRRGYNAY